MNKVEWNLVMSTPMRLKLIFLSLCSLLAFSVCHADYTDELIAADHTEKPLKELSYIFKSGTEGYSCFRIPAIVKTKRGTLLAFAEARKNNCSDEEDIDLVLKRSTDGGKSWGKTSLVWSDADNTCGNPSPVVDQKNGTIHLLMTWNLGEDDIGEINRGESKDTRRVFYTESIDDGLSWAEPEEITQSVKRPAWGWYATGPGHAIQIQQGAHKGRLVVACDYIETGPDRKGYSHIIWSDDHGASWQVGGVSPQAGVNESTVAELSDGKLMLNMRSHQGARVVAISSDGGATWTNMRTDQNLVEPTCQGSLLTDDSEDGYRLFFSNPASDTRDHMTLKLSTDDGQSWDKAYEVYAGPAAYSDIVMLGENEIGIVYEAGKDRPYEGIVFETIMLDDLKSIP